MDELERNEALEPEKLTEEPEAAPAEAPATEAPAAETPAEEAPAEAAPASAPVQPQYRYQQPVYRQTPPEATFGQTQWYYSQQQPNRQQPVYAQPAPGQTRAAAAAKPPKKKKKKKGMSALGVIAISLACALLGGLVGGLITKAGIKTPEAQTDPALIERIEALEKAEKKVPLQQAYDAQPSSTATEVYEQNVDSVVGVTTGATTTNVFGQSSSIASAGSGFIVRDDGYVVTNYHVIQGGTTLSVTTRDGMEYPAEVVGYDSSMDVAVLKIDAPDLRAVTTGDSDLLRVGDQVAAIGNPLGELTLSMTVGYISALDREINTDGVPINMLQTDVAINSGNSGGPLFDMKGNVIGITTAKFSGSTSSGAAIEGIGFAIPINDVQKIVDDLLELGYITGRAYLGITAMDMDTQTAQVYSLPVGAYVNSVVDGCCAQKAGIQTGDIILSLGEYEISCYADLSRALREFAPGDETTVEIYRAGARMTLKVVFDERPSDEELNQQAEAEAEAQQEAPAEPETEVQPVPEPQPDQGSGSYGFDFGPFGGEDVEDFFRYFFGG